MSTNVESLVNIVRQYFPRGRLIERPGAMAWPELCDPPSPPPPDFPHEAWPPYGYEVTVEHQRLVAARKNAGAQQAAWMDALQRIHLQFPACVVQNNSVHLPSGSFDSAYSGSLALPSDDSPNCSRELQFAVSFIAPYYACSYSSRTYQHGRMVDSREDEDDMPLSDESQPEAKENEIMYGPSGELSIPQLPQYAQSFELPVDAIPYWRTIERILQEKFPGYGYLEPDIGTLRLPDVVTDFKFFGEATLYDCIFTSHW